MAIALALTIPWLLAAVLAAMDGRRRWVGIAAVAGLAAQLAVLAVLALQVSREGVVETVAGGWAPGVGIALRADTLGILFAVLSSAVLFVALLYELLGGIASRSFPALVLFLAAGLTGLFLTADVFNFFVFFELSMISAYVLSVYGEERRQLGAGLIFAVVNLLGSFLFLISVAAMYHVTGTLEMGAIAERIEVAEPNAVILIAITVFVAFGVKLGLFPFHFWLPPLYTNARPAVAAILSGALANIGSYGLIRFGAGMLEQELRLGAGVLLLLGVASIVYGSIQAIARRNIGEVLAYSAIGQAGFILVALAIGGPVGYAAAVLYAIVNSLNKVVLFLAAGLRGWLAGAAFVLGAFSVAGIPPSPGFFGKVAVFHAAIAEGRGLLVALLFLGGALSFVYMFQIYQHQYWRERQLPLSAGAVRVVTLAVAAVLVVIGAWPEPLLAVSESGAAGARP
jgi:multicomponent Na+:H+ antiporter subunit D